MKQTLLLFFVVFLSLSAFSQLSSNKDSSNKKPPVPKDRNMFGHYIPRGLTITSEGLANGYVMFAVPNSASVYLINRKGEVVHEWKGNYGNFSTVAYLQNDGSIFQNVVDPDFPVFAGGGESGRIDKITWDGKTVWDFNYATGQYLSHT